MNLPEGLPPLPPACGDYVLATKYSEGDPRDSWGVGFIRGMTDHVPPRFDVEDGSGSLLRGNGFRRCEKISADQGKWLLDNRRDIETSGNSIWSYLKTPAAEDRHRDALELRCAELEAALEDIRDWDDSLEDKWGDPGYRASSALSAAAGGNGGKE